jgi:MoxR-like ATPase
MTDPTPFPSPEVAAAPAPAAAADDAALREAMNRVRIEVGKAVIGQDGTVTGLLIALLARGHVLLEGVPGVAKTLLVRAFSGALGLDTKRIQFTPDLMPGDVSGSLIYDARAGEFEFREGPVFTNVVLADEINRTPPKTQSALLEAMEERQVSTDGVTRPLPDPFLVAATQNPIEQEGTYTLPEAQLDRFLLKLIVDIPPREAELAVLRRHAEGFDPRNLAAAGLRTVVTAEEIRGAQRAAASVTVADDVLGYVVDLAQATRRSPSVQLGVSPRATTALLAAAKAWAWLGGYPAITPDHVQTMLVPTWRHRIRLRPDAELEGVSVDAVLGSVLQQTRVPI